MSRSQDEEQLNLLAIFHYVLAGVMALFSCLPMIHLAIGIAIVMGAMDGGKEPPPPFVGWIIIAIAAFFILCGWTFAVCVFVAGRKLARRRSRMFCLVVAGLECIFMPVGTALGVFTIIILMRESVVALFAEQDRGRGA